MSGARKIGRYEVLRHLASGGMGQIYLGRATGLGGFARQVVIKTLDLPSDVDEHPARIAMFLDEARLLGAIHHQFITPVHEVGCTDEGQYFLVMEYVHGQTAEAVFGAVDERGLKVPVGFALAVGVAIASALAYVHELCGPDGTPLEAVHRDVSPSNILIGYDGSVRLIDFGIARASNRENKTRPGALKGNIGYLAPEQVLAREVDGRADLFALGVVLHELTTARRTFRDRTDFMTLEKIVSGEVTPPSSLVPGYLPELERIVLKALAYGPEDRYQNGLAMVRDLEALAAAEDIAYSHTVVAELMAALFTVRLGRRRLARGSVEFEARDVASLLPEPVDAPAASTAPAVPDVIEIPLDEIVDGDAPPLLA